jgi:hypothetical protein
MMFGLNVFLFHQIKYKFILIVFYGCVHSIKKIFSVNMQPKIFQERDRFKRMGKQLNSTP